MNAKALITNIQRCSVHDGPGIRTTVFFKGCNMNCEWCHNPETILFKPEYLLYPEKCIGCGMCEDGCFAGAKVLCGEYMTIDEIVEQVLLDKDYYAKTGGVAISGGEPTCQPAALISLLKQLKEHGIHTAIESNMNCDTVILDELVKYCDLIMMDVKIFDEEKSILHTGASNKKTLDNLAYLKNIPIIVRTPVIVGINDTEQEIFNISEYASRFSDVLYYELLPYHALGNSKNSESKNNKQFQAPSKERMLELADIAHKNIDCIYIEGIKVR